MRQREHHGISTGNTIRRSEIGIRRIDFENPNKHKFFFTSRKCSTRFINGYFVRNNKKFRKFKLHVNKHICKNIENDCLNTLNELKEDLTQINEIREMGIREMGFYQDIKLCSLCKQMEDKDELYIHTELDKVYEIYEKIRQEDTMINIDDAYTEYEKMNKEWIFV